MQKIVVFLCPNQDPDGKVQFNMNGEVFTLAHTTDEKGKGVKIEKDDQEKTWIIDAIHKAARDLVNEHTDNNAIPRVKFLPSFVIRKRNQETGETHVSMTFHHRIATRFEADLESKTLNKIGNVLVNLEVMEGNIDKWASCEYGNRPPMKTFRRNTGAKVASSGGEATTNMGDEIAKASAKKGKKASGGDA
jgi:hypothetical protein